MSDALISPAVGGAMWTATAVTTMYCARKVRDEADERIVPLMGVVGAFVFAAQMLNFQIPGTGSSGHLGGGLILAALLGPHAAFLVMTSVLGVQALFFADGGLLSLGANIFNLAFFPAFIAYPLVYRTIVGPSTTRVRVIAGSVFAGIVGLQLGALGVVGQTTLSDIAALPPVPFAAVMVPIHLAIGIVEGLVTAGVILFVASAAPEMLHSSRAVTRRAGWVSVDGVSGDGATASASHASTLAARRVLIGFVVAALLTGGVLSWFAATDPDGLEWSIAKVTGNAALDTESARITESLEKTQERTAILPDYGLRGDDASSSVGTSLSGFVGAALTLGIAVGVGFVLRRRAARRGSA